MKLKHRLTIFIRPMTQASFTSILRATSIPLPFLSTRLSIPFSVLYHPLTRSLPAFPNGFCLPLHSHPLTLFLRWIPKSYLIWQTLRKMARRISHRSVKLRSIGQSPLVAHPRWEIPSINTFQRQFVGPKVSSHCTRLLPHNHRYLHNGGAPVAHANLNLQSKVPSKRGPQVLRWE